MHNVICKHKLTCSNKVTSAIGAGTLVTTGLGVGGWSGADGTLGCETLVCGVLAPSEEGALDFCPFPD